MVAKHGNKTLFQNSFLFPLNYLKYFLPKVCTFFKGFFTMLCLMMIFFPITNFFFTKFEQFLINSVLVFCFIQNKEQDQLTPCDNFLRLMCIIKTVNYPHTF